jgi:Primase X
MSNNQSLLGRQQRKQKVIEGINLLFNLFEQAGQHATIFPRKVMTAKYSGQFTVDSKEQMIKVFEEADFVDCRINAYPVLSDGVLQIPNIILLDIDVDGKKGRTGLLSKIVQHISEYTNNSTGSFPVLWTGNGYHVIVVLNLQMPLEHIKEYAELDGSVVTTAADVSTNRISNEFIRFSKSFLSNNKADPKNNPTLSSCLLRVPYTLNSKRLNAGNNKTQEESEVKIIQNWNNDDNGGSSYIPSINDVPLLLSGFYTHLVSKKIEREKEEIKLVQQKQRQKQFSKYSSRRSSSATSNFAIIPWIERLLQTPIADCRKNAIDLILTRYLVNVKHLSAEDSHVIIRDWLDKCNNKSAAPLEKGYDYESRIRLKLRDAVRSGWLPMRRERLKEKLPELYQILFSNK